MLIWQVFELLNCLTNWFNEEYGLCLCLTDSFLRPLSVGPGFRFRLTFLYVHGFDINIKEKWFIFMTMTDIWKLFIGIDEHFEYVIISSHLYKLNVFVLSLGSF